MEQWVGKRAGVRAQGMGARPEFQAAPQLPSPCPSPCTAGWWTRAGDLCPSCRDLSSLL